MHAVGLKDLKNKLTATVEQLDDQRLQHRFTGIGLTPIGAIEMRRPVRLGGEVKQIRMAPRAGSPSIEVIVSDGSGEATAVFTGRRSIGGMDHGRGIVLEGVAFVERGRIVVFNPAYTLLPAG
jgi:hypothetical protein